MKKVLLAFICGFMSLALVAQSPSMLEAEKMVTVVKGAPAYMMQAIPGIPSAPYGPAAASADSRASDCAIGEVIGTTTYDLQTNSAVGNRHLEAGGDHHAVWTGSTEGTTTWSDRGGFYNSQSGGSWGSAPTSREESVRTGWPTLVHVASGEVMFSHDPAAFGYTVSNRRSSVGSGAWTENTTALNGIWPRAITGSSSSDTIHIITTDYQNENGNMYMLYHRSTDGGVSYDITDMVLPGIDSITGGYVIMGGDAYHIDAVGQHVVIAAGNTVNDWAVWESMDAGSSWTRTRIMDFPLDNYRGDQVSDGDMDGDIDTLLTTSADHQVLIDDNGDIHAWAGALRMFDDDSTDNAWSFFPGTGGLFYWNSSMGADSFRTIAITEDVDGNGDLTGIGADVTGSYGTGLVSHPAASIDPNTGTIYLIYMNCEEFTDILEDPSDATAKSFRDFYGMITDNYGLTWTQPINLTRTACNWEENAFPQVTRETDGANVRIHWQVDEEPGISVGTNADHSVGEAEILFAEIPYTRFTTYNPIAGFDYVLNSSTLFTIFTNESCDMDCSGGSWDWDFDDGGATSSLREPTHTFSGSGTYNVCLTVTNRHGSDMDCQTITITGIEELDLTGQVSFFPNPTNDKLTISITDRAFENITVNVFNAVGQSVASQSGVNLNSSQSLEMDMGSLGAGAYFIELVTDEGTYTELVTVN